MATTKKKVTKKKPAKKAPAKKPAARRKKKNVLPVKARCERGMVHPDVGDSYEGYFLPETEIEVPEELAGIVYPLESVAIDPTNPRKAKDIEILVESIKRFGMRTPLIVNSKTMEIEAGHQRRTALKRLGVNFAPMVFVRDTDIEAAAFNIADNRTAEIVAEWDEVALSRIFGVLQKEDALKGVGFDDQSLADLRLRLSDSEIDGMEGFGRDHEGRGKDMARDRGNGKPKGDGNWFYVEYYGEEQGKVFDELKELIGEYMVTGHEVDPEFFADMVRKARR